jgi:hypothetical protein
LASFTPGRDPLLAIKTIMVIAASHWQNRKLLSRLQGVAKVAGHFGLYWPKIHWGATGEELVLAAFTSALSGFADK